MSMVLAWLQILGNTMKTVLRYYCKYLVCFVVCGVMKYMTQEV